MASTHDTAQPLHFVALGWQLGPPEPEDRQDACLRSGVAICHELTGLAPSRVALSHVELPGSTRGQPKLGLGGTEGCPDRRGPVQSPAV
eukprot:9914538-Alexandrium_andersonii.AAC.1